MQAFYILSFMYSIRFPLSKALVQSGHGVKILPMFFQTVFWDGISVIVELGYTKSWANPAFVHSVWCPVEGLFST